MAPVQFTAPLFLYGMFAVLFVVLIHLLKRPKTVKLTFSTLRFFEASAVSAKRSRKLRKWLLFITRVSLILLLSLIFAGPYPGHSPLQLLHDPTTALYIFSDNTPSMDYTENGTTPAAQSQQLIDSLAAHHSQKRQIYLYEESSASFIPYTNEENKTSSAGYSFNGRRFSNACEAAVVKNQRAVFILLSDLQHPLGSLFDTLFSTPPLRHASVVYCPLAPKKPWNVAITSVLPLSGTPPSLSVQISSHSQKPVLGQLSTKINNISSTPQEVTLQPNSDTTIVITVPSLQPGGTGTVYYNCNDPLAFDNKRVFSVNANRTTSVLVIGNTQQVFPLVTALGALPHTTTTRSIATCTHEALSAQKLLMADILFVSGGEGAVQTIKLIERTRRQTKQVIITAIDSSLSKKPLTWQTTANPLSIFFTDTLSGLWRGFPSLHAKEVHIYGYTQSITGTTVASLSNGVPFATMAPAANGNLSILLASPLKVTPHNNLCETAFYIPLIDRLLGQAEAALSSVQTPWIVGAPIKNPFYGNDNPVPVLDASDKQVLLLQQQPHFTVNNPGLYRVCPPEAPSYITIACITPLESRINYQLPDTTTAENYFRVSLSPSQLLAHCSSENGLFWQFGPWMLLAVFLLGELLLREKTYTPSRK